MEEQRGRVVVSRARRGIIHPTKVAALRQEQGPTLTTYSGRRRARSIRVREGEAVRAAGPSSRARFLAHFFSASFCRASIPPPPPAISLPLRSSSSLPGVRRFPNAPYLPSPSGNDFPLTGYPRPSFSPLPRALQPSPLVFIHPHRSYQTHIPILRFVHVPVIFKQQIIQEELKEV